MKLGVALTLSIAAGCPGPIAADAGSEQIAADAGPEPDTFPADAGSRAVIDAGPEPDALATDAGSRADAGGGLPAGPDAGSAVDAGPDAPGGRSCLDGDRQPGTDACGFNENGAREELCINGYWTTSMLCLDVDVCLNEHNDDQGPACGPNGRGQLTRKCIDGQWVFGACIDNDTCVDGETDANGDACGFNLRGTSDRLCVEGAWAPQNTCSNDPDTCVDATSRRTNVPCGLNDRGWEAEDCIEGQWTDLDHCDECGDEQLSQSVVVNAVADLAVLEGVTELTGVLRINDFDLETLPPLPALACVGSLVISSPGALTSLAGLENLVEVKGDVFFVGVGAIPTFDGLHRLRRVRGDFSLQDTTDGRTNLAGLESLRWVEGAMSLRIEQATSLQGLESLEAVQDFQLFRSQVTSLSALESLNRFGGFKPPLYSAILDIYNNDALTDISALAPALAASPNTALNLSGNNALVDLGGLQAVTELRRLRLTDNDGLQTLQGLEGLKMVSTLTIDNNDGLLSLQGLDGLEEVTTFQLKRNDLLVDLQSLGGLTTMSEVSGYRPELIITDNPSLPTLAGLQAVFGHDRLEVAIQGNGLLTNLQGLNGLEEAGLLSIWENGQLVDLEGLDALQTISWLSIGYNPSLVSLTGAPTLAMVSETITIYNNDALLDLNGLASITSELCRLDVRRNASLTSIEGLGNLATIGPSCADPDQPGSSVFKYVKVEQNDALISLRGLEHVIELEQLIINGNPLLTDLQGLENLTHVDTLRLTALGYGPEQGLVSLDGLDALTSIGRRLVIDDQPQLIDISALAGVDTPLEGLLIARCPQLLSLSGLENITTVESLTLGTEFTTDDELGNLNNLDGLSGLTTVDWVVINHLAASQSLAPLAGLSASDGTPVSWTLRRSTLTGLQAIGDSGAVHTLELDRINTPTGDLDGLQGLTSVERLLAIESTELVSLQGLENVTTVGYELSVDDNDLLTSLDGLWGVTLTGRLSVYGNAILPQCEAEAYVATLQLNGFDGSVSMAANDYNATCP